MACAGLSRSRAPAPTSGSLRASTPGLTGCWALCRHGEALGWPDVHYSTSPPNGSRSSDGMRPDSDGSKRSPLRFDGPRSRPGPTRCHLRHQHPFRPKSREEVMTTDIALFEPDTASEQLWAAFNVTRRAIAREF